jgi:prolyl 4-hydroxylase
MTAMTKVSLELADNCMKNGRPADAVGIIQQLASTGDPRALFVLGNLTWGGALVPQDPKRGRYLFECAASRGDAEANMAVTNLLASGIAGQRDWLLAISRLADEGRVLLDRKVAAELIARMNLDDHGEGFMNLRANPVSDRPVIKMFRQLFTKDECKYLIRAAHPHFKPSLVNNKDRQPVRDPIRTSDGAAIHWLIEDPAIHALNRRVAAATGTNYEDGEALQVLRYSPGQQYRPHFDFAGNRNPRLWTVLIYLNDDFDGGLTSFPKIGIALRGNTGDALFFCNSTKDRRRDPLSEHAGQPVKAGTKYLATRWIREFRWLP